MGTDYIMLLNGMVNDDDNRQKPHYFKIGDMVESVCGSYVDGFVINAEDGIGEQILTIRWTKFLKAYGQEIEEMDVNKIDVMSSNKVRLLN